jgi:hypothetical protein
MDSQTERGNTIRALKELLAEDVGTILARYGPDPEAVIRSIQNKIRPLLQFFSEHDKRLNLEVYQAFATLLSEGFSLTPEDALEWVFSRVGDDDFPSNSTKLDTINACESKIDRPVALRLVFRRGDQSGSYERLCELYIVHENRSAKKLAARSEVTWDGLQSDVQEHFLRSGDKEFSFQIIPRPEEED